MEYIVSQVSDWNIVARGIVSHCVKHALHVVLLSGDLGAGKTTLVQELAKELNVRETVSSPTFVIRKSYPIEHETWKLLVHADLYRLSSERELDLTSIRNDIESETSLVCIEWPEQIPEVMSVPHLRVTITHEEKEIRKVVLQ